ncbi:hypothetical protein HBH56_198770 [Parastagonospora nodorum]|nr:hypothetical protein HBH56_198770 [Parastagonospora nodorum]KAH3924574.1 hypothetical protein HBH54_191730 [Parastagonospora nodorum]KAH4150434.1 hypothetical protein HBH44_182200 [Parastagonospora nodorum]KAH4347623.1 hypothetical protein HBH98_095820 [Parastagonospora nodorum]KAH4378648.1 hypothetical protein HBH99_203180 [Parastagonospora nodorum]
MASRLDDKCSLFDTNTSVHPPMYRPLTDFEEIIVTMASAVKAPGAIWDPGYIAFANRIEFYTSCLHTVIACVFPHRVALV